MNYFFSIYIKKINNSLNMDILYLFISIIYFVAFYFLLYFVYSSKFKSLYIVFFIFGIFLFIFFMRKTLSFFLKEFFILDCESVVKGELEKLRFKLQFSRKNVTEIANISKFKTLLTNHNEKSEIKKTSNWLKIKDIELLNYFLENYYIYECHDLFIHSTSSLFYGLKENNLERISDLMQNNLVCIYNTDDFLRMNNVFFLQNGKKMILNNGKEKGTYSILSVKGSYTLKSIYNHEKIKELKKIKYERVTSKKFNEHYENNFILIRKLKSLREEEEEEEEKLNLSTEDVVKGRNSLREEYGNMNFLEEISEILNYRILLQKIDVYDESHAKIAILDINLDTNCYESNIININKNFKNQQLVYSLIRNQFL